MEAWTWRALEGEQLGLEHRAGGSEVRPPPPSFQAQGRGQARRSELGLSPVGWAVPEGYCGEGSRFETTEPPSLASITRPRGHRSFPSEAPKQAGKGRP